MSENPADGNSLAGPTPGKREELKPGEVREIRPYVLDKEIVDNGFDFRPKVLEADAEEVVDPKDLSAPEPASSSESETKTLVNPSVVPSETLVTENAVKVSTPPKASSPGTLSSSPGPSRGKNTPTVSD